ncbi:type II secretion system F family protein [Rhizobium lusitanum]|uniref:Tight adherence protein B n=1 Tax=Rhizobium lusitanum TaxID=293958 RepID=A0A7X0IU00_9HYPH|nr:type II secretion system F family protein [Rhizobium lusitanum]MBB6487054.1 tight adherence protein B [Rhizobium lusitanum]
MDINILQFGSIILGAVAVGLLVAGAPVRWPDPLLRATERDTALASEAAQVFGRDAVPPYMMILAHAISGLLVFILVAAIFGPLLGLIIAVPIAIFLPKATIRYLLQRRWRQIEAQLPYAVDQIVSAVRTGKPLAVAVNAVADTGQMPSSNEFERIAREQKLGISLVEALDRHGRLVPSLHFKMVDAALGLFARQGGDIAEPLTEMSKSFKEIWKLDQKIMTSSSQARMNFRVVNGGALMMVLMIFFAQPELIDKVLGSGIGIVIAFAGVILYVCGFLWMRSMMKVSV